MESFVLETARISQKFGWMLIVCVAVSGPQTCATTPSGCLLFGMQPRYRSMSAERRTKFIGPRSRMTRFNAARPLSKCCRFASSSEPNHTATCLRSNTPHLCKSLQPTIDHLNCAITQRQNSSPKFGICHVRTDRGTIESQENINDRIWRRVSHTSSHLKPLHVTHSNSVADCID